MSSAACAPPTCSKAKSTAARSRIRRSSGTPSPKAPSGSPAAPSKTRRACARLASMVATASRLTPAEPRSTMKSESARSAGRSPRAATMARSAQSPSGTGTLAPVNRPAATLARNALASTAPGPSASASVPIAPPEARRGSQRSFCAALPAMSSASAARYAEDENGTGASAYPSSSASTQRPRCPKPAPSYSSGIAAPIQPIRAISCHSALSKPPPASSTRRAAPLASRSRRNLRAWSRSAFRSSEKSKFTPPPSELDALRQRAVDNEIGAADDAGARARQEHRRVGDLLRRPHAARRVARQRRLVDLRPLLLGHVPHAAFEIDRAGRHHVGADVLGGEVARQRFDVGHQRRLDRGVGPRRAGDLDEAGGADDDDGAGLRFLQRRQRRLAAEHRAHDV